MISSKCDKIKPYQLAVVMTNVFKILTSGRFYDIYLYHKNEQI